MLRAQNAAGHRTAIDGAEVGRSIAIDDFDRPQGRMRHEDATGGQVDIAVIEST